MLRHPPSIHRNNTWPPTLPTISVVPPGIVFRFLTHQIYLLLVKSYIWSNAHWTKLYVSSFFTLPAEVWRDRVRRTARGHTGCLQGGEHALMQWLIISANKVCLSTRHSASLCIFVNRHKLPGRTFHPAPLKCNALQQTVSCWKVYSFWKKL